MADALHPRQPHASLTGLSWRETFEANFKRVCQSFWLRLQAWVHQTTSHISPRSLAAMETALPSPGWRAHSEMKPARRPQAKGSLLEASPKSDPQ
ncbi:Hypothetical predicted protein [Pelobates cultripes]|uniref:Uncharacterized protein n=1 Tax=Pelobates cultripes TaxID=61616 RepID=A0AAD1VJF4_PELCU|nr:Hypothetical predicted protein [Pelobates cultripes]